MNRVLAQSLKIAIAAVVGIAIIAIMYRLNFFSEIEAKTMERITGITPNDVHEEILATPRISHTGKYLGFDYSYLSNGDGTYTCVMTGTQTIEISETSFHQLMDGDLTVAKLLESPYIDESFYDMTFDALSYRGITSDTKRHEEKVTKVIFKNAKVTSACSLLAGCEAEEIEFINTDLSNVTDFTGMFGESSNLKKVTMPAITSNAISLMGMFDLCTQLEEIEGIEEWDVSNVTDFTCMFQGCEALTSLDLSSWRPTKAVDIIQMFEQCTNLKSLNLEGWDMPNVETIERFLCDCESLTDLNMTSWNTPKLQSMHWAFHGCTSLESVDLSSVDVSNVSDMEYVFYECYELKTINLTGWQPSKVNTMCGLFSGCISLTTVTGIEDLDVSSCEDFRYMFATCRSLAAIDISRWNISPTADLGAMFVDCPATVTGASELTDRL